MIRLIINGKQIWDHYVTDEVTVYAAQASFFIVIAFFPATMLLLTLLQFTPSVTKSDLLTILVRLMPNMLDSLVIGIVDDLYVKSPATILSVTALAALWSAARGMMGIERGLNRIYGVLEKRSYVVRRLVCAAYTLVFISVCVVSMVLLVLGTSLQNLFIRLFPFLEPVMSHIISLRSLLALILFMAFFVGLYSLVPKKKQRPRRQIPGAAFSAIGWIVFSYAFSMYFTHFNRFSYMYGSLTAIVLMMLWLYFCICILFIGAEINHFLEYSGYLHPPGQ